MDREELRRIAEQPSPANELFVMRDRSVVCILRQLRLLLDDLFAASHAAGNANAPIRYLHTLQNMHKDRATDQTMLKTVSKVRNKLHSMLRSFRLEKLVDELEERGLTIQPANLTQWLNGKTQASPFNDMDPEQLEISIQYLLCRFQGQKKLNMLRGKNP